MHGILNVTTCPHPINGMDFDGDNILVGTSLGGGLILYDMRDRSELKIKARVLEVEDKNN